jgi:hypothetical protein
MHLPHHHIYRLHLVVMELAVLEVMLLSKVPPMKSIHKADEILLYM